MSFAIVHALSRLPPRRTGAYRTRDVLPLERKSSPDHSHLWRTSMRIPMTSSQGALHSLLLLNRILVVEREIEMLNIFVGFEQSNRYTISNEAGVTVGYIAEEPKGFLSTLARQAFATHRPFRAVVMDPEGSPILWIRRPFSWINSRMFVQRLKNYTTSDEEPVLDSFAEVQQVWHPWRRRYDLFLRDGQKSILSTATESQSEPPTSIFTQLAKVDMGFLSWQFRLLDHQGDEIAYISRAFRGFGREIFTDTGQYSLTFGPRPVVGIPASNEISHPSHVFRKLTLDERALVLALAINIDFDYFSWHSGAVSGGLFGASHW